MLAGQQKCATYCSQRVLALHGCRIAWSQYSRRSDNIRNGSIPQPAAGAFTIAAAAGTGQENLGAPPAHAAGYVSATLPLGRHAGVKTGSAGC